MKMTCSQWTTVQKHLPGEDGDGSAGTKLWERIEHKTFGKLYQTQVAISLTKEDQAMVLDAIEAAVAAREIKDADKPKASKQTVAAYNPFDY